MDTHVPAGAISQSDFYIIVRRACLILESLFEILLYLKALIVEVAVTIATLPTPNLHIVGRQTREEECLP